MAWIDWRMNMDDPYIESTIRALQARLGFKIDPDANLVADGVPIGTLRELHSDAVDSVLDADDRSHGDDW